MVVLSFTVTDSKGQYINGLKPSDFRIPEDGIPQKIATFAEGNKPPVQVAGRWHHKPLVPGEPGEAPASRDVDRAPMRSSAPTCSCCSIPAITCIADSCTPSDAIADFVRGLDRADSVAVYTFSRNLSRAAPLTRDRNDAIIGAAQGGGRRRHGALQRPAADLARCRQGARTQGGDRVLERSRQRQHGGAGRRARGGRGRGHSDLRHLDERGEQGSDLERRVQAHLQRTGGKAYFAKTWQKQVEAFESIREDLGNSYTITYYPQPNPNEGFRKITSRSLSDAGQEVSRPGPARVSAPRRILSRPRVAFLSRGHRPPRTGVFWAPTIVFSVGFIGIRPDRRAARLRFQESAGRGHRGDVRRLPAPPGAGRRGVRGTARGSYRDFRKLLDDKDIQAVVVSTPDHWHALMTMMACAAGKDVYVEKPLTLFVARGALDGRGGAPAQPRRAGGHAAALRPALPDGPRADPARLHRQGPVGARMGAYRNIMPGFGSAADGPAAASLDYDMWLGPAPERPYNPHRGLYHFRWFWDYSGGQMTNLGAHEIDIVQWCMGVQRACRGVVDRRPIRA